MAGIVLYKLQQKTHLKMDDDAMVPAPSCTGLSMTSLTDGVWTLFAGKQQNDNTPPSKEPEKSPTPKKKTRSVKFQYPVITKTHHRPMTEDEDVENLFFTEEEMEVLEEDRLATKFADDVEVLAEGQSWDAPIFQLSTSGSNLSIEEDYVPTKKPLPVKVGEVQNENGLSPRSKSIQALSILSERNSNKKRKKRDKKRDACSNPVQEIVKPKIVQGVQIMLREKSSTNDMYLM